jgi:hypothetical protein
MTIAGLGVEGPFEQLSNADGARELVFASDTVDPFEIGGVGSRPEKLRDRVRVEEKRHRFSVQ